MHTDYEIDDLSAEFEVDTEAISSAFVNIIENSIDACLDDKSGKTKYFVKITVTGDEDCINIDVHDNGIGMNQETRENIFTLFFSSKGNRGTGLGLFVANQIIEKHGGKIKVESNPGEGSNFKITVPRIISEESKKLSAGSGKISDFNE